MKSKLSINNETKPDNFPIHRNYNNLPNFSNNAEQAVSIDIDHVAVQEQIKASPIKILTPPLS